MADKNPSTMTIDERLQDLRTLRGMITSPVTLPQVKMVAAAQLQLAMAYAVEHILTLEKLRTEPPDETEDAGQPIQ